MSVTRRVFPEAFKREAVERVATSGLSAGAVVRDLGLHETVLRRWMMQFGAQATGTRCEREARRVRRRRPTMSKP
ncbi:transposase-like protein [Phenylobacterium koreense]|uniref:Transposase-like protein n=1 Tax=Phenylobacterium koreense TaxID=266125 RepID=A0ABV2ELV8_9CAUL